MSVEFLDSNIFIYLFDETDDRKRGVAERLIHQGLASGSACISYQVVQETLNVLSGKLAASAADARSFLDRVLIPVWRVMPSQALYLRGLDLRERYGYSLYDSMIVAAALQAGATTLYSEDLQHGQRIEALTIRNPFA
jgi:predicted nucleic acid-binding protein